MSQVENEVRRLLSKVRIRQVDLKVNEIRECLRRIQDESG